MGKQSEKLIAIDDGQRWSHIHIIGVLEKEKQSNVKEMLFKVIIQKNLPNGQLRDISCKTPRL